MSWRNRLFNTAGGRTDCMGADDRWHSVPVDMASVLYVLFAWASVREPSSRHYVMVILVVLPPFYFSRFGDTPIYISVVLLPICLAVVVVRLPDFRLALDPIARGIGLFLAGTGLSLPLPLASVEWDQPRRLCKCIML